MPARYGPGCCERSDDPRGDQADHDEKYDAGGDAEAIGHGPSAFLLGIQPKVILRRQLARWRRLHQDGRAPVRRWRWSRRWACVDRRRGRLGGNGPRIRRSDRSAPVLVLAFASAARRHIVRRYQQHRANCPGAWYLVRIEAPPGLRESGTVPGVSRLDEPQAHRASFDAERVVDLNDEDFVVLPDQSVDDTDRGWGEYPSSNDDWLLSERPPHWD